MLLVFIVVITVNLNYRSSRIYTCRAEINSQNLKMKIASLIKRSLDEKKVQPYSPASRRNNQLVTVFIIPPCITWQSSPASLPLCWQHFVQAIFNFNWFAHCNFARNECLVPTSVLIFPSLHLIQV